MCNSMRKSWSTGSSGIDDYTAECQALNRSLYALKEGDMFGDSDDDEDEVMENTQLLSNDDSSSDDDLDILVH